MGSHQPPPSPRTLRPARRRGDHAPEALEPRRLLAGNVYTFHNDAQGTGVNHDETQLTPGNVTVATFAKHWSTAVDGQVYAQPLYVSGQNITAGAHPGVHNVAYVATQHDSVYAIDGDSGEVLWKVTVLGAGEMTMPSGETNSGDISPEIGITGTPVIDPATGTLYVVAKSRKTTAQRYVYRLHALDLADGAEKFGGPVEISDTTYSGGSYTYASPLTHPYVRGTGDGAITATVNGSSVRIVPFNAMRQMNRPGLSLHNGQVYIAFASHGDNGPYHGWVLRYDVPETNDPGGAITLNGVLNTTPNGGLGGIWQSGGSLVFDPQGAMYFETGNGTFTNTASNFNTGFTGLPRDANYGDSFVKVVDDPASTVTTQNPNGWGLKVADYFTPFNEPDLDAADTDLGSGGPLVLPDSVGSAAHPRLLVGAGKEGKIYLLDRDHLGGYDPATDHVVQEQSNAINGSLGVPAFFNNTIYYVGGYGDVAKTFSIANGRFSTSPTSTSAQSFNFPGSTPSITANGTTNGVVWTIDRQTNQLRAYNASGFNNLLWTSAQAGNSRDQLGSVVKFTVPTAVDGKVFVGTANALVSYGPPVPPTAPPLAPAGLTATTRFATEIDLAWQDVATNEALYHVERSPDGQSGWTEVGTAGVNATSFIDSTVQPVTHYYYRVYASNALGNSPYSNTADATTATAPPPGAGDGLRGEYFNSMDFTGNPVVRVDPTVNFDWGNGAPSPGIGDNNFSVRWTGQVQAPVTGTYTFYTQSDDGVRLTVNNQLIIDNFTDHGPTENTGTVSLVAGRSYPVLMEFYENGGGAVAQLRWSAPSIAKQVVPKQYLFSGVAPAAPTFLTAAAASATQVNLSWRDNSGNESGFKIERREGAGGAWAQVAQVGPDETTYMDTALNATATYVYRVRAANFGSDSPYSNEAAVTLPTAPATPSNARAEEVTTTSLKLTWSDNSDNEDGWRLWRKKSDSDTFNILANLDQNATSYDDANLSPGTKYDYHIQAFNVAGYSDFAGVTVTTVTNPPTGLTATPGGGSVALTWAATPGAETYTVYRSTTPGAGYGAVATGVETPSFTDTAVTPGTTYYYVVTAATSGGESDPSAQASATPTASNGPRVTDVLLAGSSWAPEFLNRLAADGLGDGGFALRGTDLPPVPWGNVDRVKVRFDRDVVVAQGDLTVHGVAVLDYAIATFAYDPAGHTATWTLERPLVSDRLTLGLSGAVHDASNVPLDGGAKQYRFDALPGDVNRGGQVNAVDMSQVRARQLTSTAAPGTAPGAYGVTFDVNGDGRVNAVDLAQVRSNQLHTLPAAPAAVALFSETPVRDARRELAALLE